MIRNRVARRIRHQIAPLLPLLPDGTDVVVRANPAAATASSTDLASALQRALRDHLPPPQGEPS